MKKGLYSKTLIRDILDKKLLTEENINIIVNPLDPLFLLESKTRKGL